MLRCMTNYIGLILIAISVLVFPACGGGSNSGSLPTAPPSDYTINGKVFIGNVNNSTISLYPYSDGKRGLLITSITSDENGLYQITTNSQNTTMLLCMTGGRYTEAFTGTTVLLKDTNELCAAFANTPGSNSNVGITYYSHIAYGLSQYLVSTNSETPIKSANNTITAWVKFDVIKTIPKDVTFKNSDSTLNEAYTAGFANVAISVLAKTNNITEYSKVRQGQVFPCHTP